MKLLECYVEKFGKIRDKKFNFKDGLNCIIEENGSGKTTLSVFIKVMLYGMSDTKKTSLDENDRKHYLPWDGGNCGGWLSFSVNGKSYRIERSFSAKASEDSFALYDLTTGKPSKDFSHSIGTELFGIDAEGFERTVFLSERTLSPSGDNKSISAKLSDLVGCDGDMGEMDKALKLLEDQRKFYQKRGGTGEISQIKAKITDIERQLDSVMLAEQALAVEEKKLVSYRSEFDKIKYDIDSLHKQKEKVTLRKANEDREARYKELRSMLNEEIAKRDALLLQFGGRLPTYDEINKAESNLSYAKAIRETEYTPSFNESSKFPAEFGKEINENNVMEARSLLTRLTSRRSIEETGYYARAKELFANRIPENDEIDRMNKLLEKAEKKPILGYALAILLCIAGAVLGVFIHEACFAACLVGIIVSVAVAIAHNSKTRKTIDIVNDFINSVANITPEKNEIRGILSEMKHLLVSDVQTQLEAETCSEILNKLAGFTDIFQASQGDCVEQKAMYIVNKYEEYIATTKRESQAYSYEAWKNDNESKARIYELSGNEFFDKYNLSGENAADRLRAMLREYETANSLIAQRQRDLEMYKTMDLDEGEEKGDYISMDEIETNLITLNQRADLISKEIALTDRSCKRYADEIERREELNMQRQEQLEKLEKQNDNLQVVISTKKYLDIARDNMTAKYLGKTKSSFIKYAEVISGQSGDFNMDTSFSVTKQEGATSRDIEAYSRGTRDLYNLATRFALVDSLYENEEPFIILDDPFTAMDDEKVKSALKMLRDIAKHRQIIYFTCSSSRGT